MTTGETIAVKQVEMPRSFSDKEDQRIKGMISSLKAEIELLKDLDHPNIVLYLGAWSRSGSALPEFRLICSPPPSRNGANTRVPFDFPRVCSRWFDRSHHPDARQGWYFVCPLKGDRS